MKVEFKMEHSAILLTYIKRLSVLKTNFWSSFEWLLMADFMYQFLCILCSDKLKKKHRFSYGVVHLQTNPRFLLIAI